MMQTNKFGYKPETGQNPYIGFMSYQHFTGEALYSDSIVHPKNNYTETEPFECYPIPPDVEEKGREQGFYPDSSIVYIRSLWKEFEPERGVYNYKFIEDILDKAKAHGQFLIFRLLPHSTRACEDVPEWLKALIPCPERPDGERVKDSPTHPLFLELFCEAIKKLGERFDRDPYFYAIDISLPGAWGEGSNLHLYDEKALLNLVDTYINIFKNTQLIGQLGKPELIHYARCKTAIGWRGDGLGSPKHIKEIYPPNIEKLADFWKDAPVSFESYWWLGEWKRQGWDIDNIIEKTLEWHISSFNGKSLPIPFEWKEKIDYWLSKMGYHYSIDYFKFPDNAYPSDSIELELGMENHGVAPIYKEIPVKIRLVNNQIEYEFDTEIDITKWLPGKITENITLNLPQSIMPGEYDIEIGIYDSLHPVIYLCTDAEQNGSFYKLGKICIL